MKKVQKSTFVFFISLFLISCGQHGFENLLEKGEYPSSSSGEKEDSKGDSQYDNCQNFNTVTIGAQTWMAENLNCNIEGSVCYNNDPANCEKYGRLYNWATAMALPSSCNSNSCTEQIQAKHKGICPQGWHIPSNADWTTLIDYAGGSSTAGTKLKATSGWNDRSNGTSGNGTDELGFAALPGGRSGYGSEDAFVEVGEYTYWWETTEINSGSAYRQQIYYNQNVVRISISKRYLRSVRCIMD